MKKPSQSIAAFVTITLKTFIQSSSFKFLILIVFFGLTSFRSYCDTPVSGVTDFNTYTSWTDLTGIQVAGTAGLKASNVKGWDFTVYSLNNIKDCGIGIDKFTAQTPMVYGYSEEGKSYLSSFKVSSNGLRYFDLTSVDICMDNGDLTQRAVTLTGYKDGNPVPGATMTMTLNAASKNALLSTYNVSSNNAFKNIDAFIISVPGTDVGAIGVDNINAVNFTNGPLPVSLVAFSGYTISDGVVLNWKTASELNTQTFQVQRSAHNLFSTIGTIPAGNASHGNTYSYTDRFSGSSENLYYRLKITDRDGQSTFSPVITIKINSRTHGYSLYPNPLTGNTLHITIPSPNSGNLRVRIISMSGKIVDERTIQTDGLASGQIPILVGKLAAGMYRVQITEEKTENVTVLQFVK